MRQANYFFPKRSLRSRLSPLRLIVLTGLLCLSLLLSGCVGSDLQINFGGQGGGEIIQQIKLAEPLTTVKGLVNESWLDQIQRQVRQVGGGSQRLSDRELQIKIPFDNGSDLARKLNQFLQPLQGATEANHKTRSTAHSGLPLPALPSHLQVTGQNFLLLLRNRFVYDLDLRALGVQSASGEVLLSPTSLLNLQISLKTPWGARSVGHAVSPLTSTDNTTLINPGMTQQGQTLTWTLQPGYINHLEAVFWYPSPIGLGAIAIALFVAAGWYLKSSSQGVQPGASS
uniref:DUF3153 domain-containing protein n=1 Tax=Cyanothece sp. (strain PCC 7425 / ATCC 29141) TaxID=395961 RepID=B8HP25_CYAP4